jgi:hypothetical protein
LADDRPTLPQLAADLGIDLGALRAWLQRHHSGDMTRVRQRRGGWIYLVGPAAESAARAFYAHTSGTESSTRQDAASPSRIESINTVEDDNVSSRLAHLVQADRVDQHVETSRSDLIELAHALAAAEGRAQAAEALVAELRPALAESREGTKAAHAQVDALYRRVGELERATGQLGERVRAWREWYARVAAASWWSRRRLPDAPEDVKPQLVE